MSSPPSFTPRTLIGKVLGELKTSQPVQRQSKRRKSRGSSRRQSLNDSTLRKQALLSSANRTEHSNISNDCELTPRSQIQEFLNAAETGVPVVRKKRRIDPDDVDYPESRPTGRTGHPTTSFLNTTEETPRTLISNILTSTETGMTGAPVRHHRNPLRTPYTSSRKGNASLPNPGSRSPYSDSSLLDVTIHNKGSEHKFGHIPGIKPQPTALADALSQVNSTSASSGNTSVFTAIPEVTGVDDVDMTHHLTDSHVPDPPASFPESGAPQQSYMSLDRSAQVASLSPLQQLQSLNAQSGVSQNIPAWTASVPVPSELNLGPSGSFVDKDPSQSLQEQSGSSVDKDPSQSLQEQSGSSVDKDPSQLLQEQSGSSVDKDPSQSLQEQSGSSVDKDPSQSLQQQSGSSMDQDPSHSMQEQSESFQHSYRQRELVIPMEVPKKQRVQLEIPFPVVRKQVSTGTGGPKEKKKPPVASRGGRPRASAGTDKKEKNAFRLPRSLIKDTFCHFSKCKNVTSAALDEIEKVSDQFWRQFTSDVTAFAAHAGRVAVTEADVELLMRRQGFVTDNQSMYTLVEKYLPLEDRELIIPMARAGGEVIPKK